jgi:hydrogenase/urease accessory protein HupE
MNESEKQIIVEGGNFEFILIGITHMITGYDHLLFIFGVVFLLSSFKEVVKYVSLFTLGHSITLILATFNSITINYFLIDAIIALSVCYIGLINLNVLSKYTKLLSMYTMIFIFGLIHGLGLSTRLQELSLNKDELLLNILSFNIGIEIGQVLALSVALFILSFIKRKSIFNMFSKVVNILIILFGLLFFVIQINDYNKSITSTTFTTVWQDELTIIIPAKSGKEHKFWIEKDKNLEYLWQSNGIELYYDFHGEPSSDTSGYFKSYKEGTSSTVKGKLTTPFMGTHGWYWKNETGKDIKIILKTNGEYKR